MTRIVNMHEAKTHLSRLVQEALEGAEVIIAKANVPLVRLVVVDDSKPARTIGTARGLVKMADDFEEPLEDFESYT